MAARGQVSGATLSKVDSLATNQTLVAANAGRNGLMIHNTDANPLYIKYGATAAIATSFSVKIAADTLWEMPRTPIYTGQIDGIWSVDGVGSAFITEL